ncbi:MAG: hypothetical protein Q8P93_04725 [bacterium]|nr:hypothetical protein [bacterium]
MSYYRITLRRILGILTISLCASILIGYAYQRTRDIAKGPIVEITIPANGTSVDGPLITVSGVARHIAFLSLNGRQIYTNVQGTFEEALLVPPGYSILEVTGRDKFDRTTTRTHHVIYNP